MRYRARASGRRRCSLTHGRICAVDYRDYPTSARVTIETNRHFPNSYGASLRKQVKKMEITQHAKYTCTFCGKVTVRRHSTGIWNCKSCKRTIAGGAYVVAYVPSWISTEEETMRTAGFLEDWMNAWQRLFVRSDGTLCLDMSPHLTFEQHTNFMS